MSIGLFVSRRSLAVACLSLTALSLVAPEIYAEESVTVKRVTPGNLIPGRTQEFRLEGTNLKTIKSVTFNFPGAPSVVVLKPCKDESAALCGNLSVPPGTPSGDYSVSTSTTDDGKKGVNVTDVKVTILPPIGSEIGYVSCPTSLSQTPLASPPRAQTLDNGLSQISCSQSLLGRNEASDIFGKRIANTYLVVQVDVRNLSDDYQFLLHDVRLIYSGQAVAGREKRLVRGVSEKGQAFDVRNMVIRSVQGTGSVLAGLSVFKFATVDFKDAVNVYQGPLAGALQSIFPDFTIGQLNRLNDLAFGMQSIVIPKQSSVAFVTFIPQQVFVDPANRKLLKTAWYDPTQPKGYMLTFQQNLSVEVAGAHVEEIQQTAPTITTLYPSNVESGKSIDFTLVGANLDRVANVRLGLAPKTGTNDDQTKTMTFPVALPQHDPKFAIAAATTITLEAGDYPVSLETAIGQSVPSTLTVTVNSPAPPSIASISPSSGGINTPVTITGTNFGSMQGKASTVKFNGTTATTITSWSPASIVAKVPVGATTGDVVVTVGGLASEGSQFTVQATPKK